MKNKAIAIVYGIAMTMLIVGALSLAVYCWYFMPCSVVKDLNLNVPGRCING